MTAKSHSRGNEIIFDEKSNCWIYPDKKRAIKESDPCGKCGKKTKIVKVKIPTDLSSNGKEKWREMRIDACVAPLVKSLQDGGIDMRGSCCGHGDMEGDIHLQDGRLILILGKQQTDEYFKTGKANLKGARDE